MKSRLTLLDAVKVAAMIMMMQGHTLDALVRSSEMDLTTFPWLIWQHLRGFTAPIFLTVSGMVFSLTMKRGSTGRMQSGQARKRVQWALLLMLLAYVLVFPASNIFHLSYIDETGWRLFLQVNILHLNAVALALVTCIALATKRDQQYRYWLIVISILITLFAPYINNIDWFAISPEALGSFFSYQHGSFFPIFPFASYMLFGAAIGSVLKSKPREEHHDYLGSSSWKLGSILFVAGLIMYTIQPHLSFLPQLDVLQSMPSTVLLREAVVLFVVSLMAQAETFIHRYRRTIELFGKQSLVIYLVHLIILFGTPWYSSFGRIYFKQMPLASGVILAFVVVIATLSVVYCENLIKHRNHFAHRTLQYILLGVVIFCLLF